MTDVVQVPSSDIAIGSFTTQAGGTTNLCLTIDEGTDSPNDSDYITGNGDPDETVKFGLGTIPTDVSVVTAVTVKLRLKRSGSTGDVQTWAWFRLYQSNGSTALIGQTTITISNNSIATFTFTPTITGATTRTAWNNAQLWITVDSGTRSGAACYAAQVGITYTATASAAPRPGLLSGSRMRAVGFKTGGVL